MKFFEDITAGQRFDLGRHRLGRDEIRAFAAAYDPAVHAAAGDRRVGDDRPIASGWLIVGLWMRGWVGFVRRSDEAARNAGETIAELGPAPGIERLVWPHPAYAGDTIAFSGEVVGLRVSRSRPKWGLISLHNTAVLADNAAVGDDVAPNTGAPPGTCVMSFTSSAFVERRDPAGAV